MKNITERIVSKAKASEIAKHAGGFAVYQLSNGDVDWFPYGQPANVAGEVDRTAKLIGKWRWNYSRWSRIA